MKAPPRITQFEDYEPLVGAETIERIEEKARQLKDLHVVNVNSTYYGGGVAALLSSLALLMNGVGIKTGWRVIQGSPDFFSITKKMHNALQGGEINLTQRKMQLYEQIIYENVIRNHLEHDVVIVHDPQPLAMINHYRRRGPWIWRCHVDLSRPNRELWRYMAPFIEKYDAVIISSKEYVQDLKTPQLVFMPAIDPFSITNREMSEDEVDERLAHYDIPVDLPLVVQISRFDPWKDPLGVIQAFKLARKEEDCTLVLLGNTATDDPEGQRVYESLLGCREERIIILSHQDSALVNALQRRAAVVLQKSLREGFGLTVAEAMWKGTPVIGGNVGGIRLQIKDGINGFLVSSIEEAAERMVRLLKDESLRERLGKNARETVRKRFLLTRYLEQYLDLFNSIEPAFRVRLHKSHKVRRAV
ncbi:MAG: glycosyltransferase [Thermodesulfobacteriota bacterium]